MPYRKSLRWFTRASETKENTDEQTLPQLSTLRDLSIHLATLHQLAHTLWHTKFEQIKSYMSECMPALKFFDAVSKTALISLV